MPQGISITLREDTKAISDYAFYNCTGLTSIAIPNRVTSIGNYAFYGCSGLTNVIVGGSVITIGESAFFGCSSLTSVNIPETVTSIGNMAFYGCRGLTSVKILDLAAWCKISFCNYFSNPLIYANHLYLDDVEIKDLVIPNSVSSIGDYAFDSCSGLTCVTIPNSVTYIGINAFSYCSGLTSVTIGKSVTTIGDYCFDCSLLTHITSLAATPPTANTNSFSMYSATLTVPIGSVEEYQATEPWSGFSIIKGVFSPGDVDGDGKVNISDVSTLIDLLLNGDDISDGADVDGDGKVNISDLSALIDILLDGNE